MFTRCVFILVFFAGCHERSHQPEAIKPTGNGEYQWKKLCDTARFMPTDRLQFLNIRDTLWAFHPNGNFYSTDGINFQLSSLELKIAPTAIAGYLFSNNKLISVIPAAGHQNMDSSMITYKSVDLLHWNLQIRTPSLASMNASVLTGFKGKIWIFGARDSSDHYISAWNSDDAIHWTKMADSIPIGPISNHRMIVFKKKLLLLSDHLWESENGIQWKKIVTSAVPSFRQSVAIQFNDLLWIFGAGAIQEGAPKILVSENARQWDTLDAPWLRRSSPAVCILRGKIVIGGGNHLVISGNHTRDSLLSDTWQME